jgi:hypothetical protein
MGANEAGPRQARPVTGVTTTSTGPKVTARRPPSRERSRSVERYLAGRERVLGSVRIHRHDAGIAAGQLVEELGPVEAKKLVDRITAELGSSR